MNVAAAHTTPSCPLPNLGSSATAQWQGKRRARGGSIPPSILELCQCSDWQPPQEAATLPPDARHPTHKKVVVQIWLSGPSTLDSLGLAYFSKGRSAAWQLTGQCTQLLHFYSATPALCLISHYYGLLPFFTWGRHDGERRTLL